MSVFGATKRLIFQEEKLEKEIEHLKETMVLLLKALVGQPIYWASPNWKHILSERSNIVWSIVTFLMMKKRNTKAKLVFALK